MDIHFDEEKYVDSYVELYFEKPTIEEYFYGPPVVYGCDDHRLRVANSEPKEQRSAKAKTLFGERQLKLKNFVSEAGKDEHF